MAAGSGVDALWVEPILQHIENYQNKFKYTVCFYIHCRLRSTKCIVMLIMSSFYILKYTANGAEFEAFNFVVTKKAIY